MLERRFWLLSWPVVKTRGFFASRIAEGRSAEEAVERAISSVRGELSGVIRNRPDEPWDIMVESVEEMPGVTSASDQFVARRGFTWFPEDDVA
jgi:hypothetical protein